uniref:DUF659 domain-containing protein n=1 Tax=Globisporangium ultimum (strain ATCC 200006 / CBS 805.95 / DAOM BR144) TaxID=431595 RepID=K3WLF3_GLOUD
MLQKKQASTGGWVNLLSDLWQNISKHHVLGCQLTLFGSLYTYSLEEVGSRHDGIAIAQQLESALLKAKSEHWGIGTIVTDNAGQCGQARRILALRWPRIAYVFYFTHDINNLVKAVLKSTFQGVAAQAASAVNCLNASSSKWLRRAWDIMKHVYGVELSFFSLRETRWNSMQACFASLLCVRTALQMLWFESRDAQDFPSTLNVFGANLLDGSSRN